MMITKLGAHVAWAVLALLFAVHTPAGAQTATDVKLVAPVVIVVDTNRIQRDAAAGKAIVAQREKYQQTFNGEFEAARKRLQKEELELSKQKAILGQQAFEERVRAFNEEVALFQRRYQSALRALEKSTAAAHNELQKATIEATSEVASEMGAGLVVHKQNVFLHDERMDVTDKVIERVNKRLPSVNFPAPVVEGATAPDKPAVSKPTKK